jgi:hypothetical protein
MEKWVNEEQNNVGLSKTSVEKFCGRKIEKVTLISKG